MATRREFLKTAAAVVGVSAVQGLTGPTGARAQKKKYQIVFHTKNVVNPFWKACSAGAKVSAYRKKRLSAQPCRTVAERLKCQRRNPSRTRHPLQNGQNEEVRGAQLALRLQPQNAPANLELGNGRTNLESGTTIGGSCS